jgi:polyisoprenoid-binding protein YceI
MHMKNLLVVAGLVAAGGLGAAYMSGAFCNACGDASQPATVTTVAMQPTITQAVVAAAIATPAPAVADAFEVDNVHSSVLFKVKHNNVSNFYGRFNEVSGTFNINKEDASKSSMDITVKAESVDSNNEGRDKHLNGPDFFSSKEFPSITFKGTKFEKAGDNQFTVTGDLTLRGVTKPVTAKVEHTGEGPGRRGGTVAGFEATVTIKRSDFGVSYMVGPGLQDDVTLIVALQGAKK